MARNLKIRDLTLRDGQQSSFATRMSQAQVDRCLPYYKDANFYAMEVWGGAVLIWLRGMYFLVEYLGLCWGWIK